MLSSLIPSVLLRHHRCTVRLSQAVNLYEYRIQELDYQQNACHIRTELSHPDILGVYELNVPLSFRLLSELGCVWSVTRKVGLLLAFFIFKLIRSVNRLLEVSREPTLGHSILIICSSLQWLSAHTLRRGQ